MEDPQVTMVVSCCFNTKIDLMTWMIWGTPILGNLHLDHLE